MREPTGFCLADPKVRRACSTSFPGGKAKTAVVDERWGEYDTSYGPYKDEVAAVDRRTLDQVSVVDFFYEYVYVVLNTGMKNQVAQRMYEAFRNSKASDPSITVGHEGKRKAIVEFTAHYRELYEQFKAAEDKIAFLGTLPFIGEVNKFHLARNLGLDVAKPDRHMVRLTKQFNFPSAQAMCEAIRAATGDRIGTIDVILWRACNLGWL